MESKMKDSGIPWIGVIPEHWNILRNKNVLIELKEVVGEDTSFPLLSLSLTGVKLRDLGAGGKFPAEFNTYKKVNPENLVFCLFDMDETPRTIGLSKFRGMITGAYNVYRVCPEVVTPDWVYYFYLSIDQQKALKPYYSGLRKVVKPETFAKIHIPVPPIAEQERIAAYLDGKCGEIDELIDAEQQMISDLESYRQAVITEAVTHGLNPDVPVKETTSFWLPKIPAHWELHYLRGISKGFRKGNGITKEDLIPDGNIACVRYGDLYTKYNHHISDIHCRTNVSKIQNPVYAAYGDIYFTCSGEDVDAIGKSAAYLSDEDCLIGGDLIIMKHSQNPKFLGYSLDSIISQKQKSYGKSKLKVVHTSVKDLKNVAVAIPPLSEQKKIAEYLDAKCSEIDELIKVKQEKIETLKQYRQSLIFEAVTGKTPIIENL